jgi:putative transposase
MRLIAYGLMPNHFHLVIRPHADGELSRRMHRLLTTHVRRYLRHYQRSGHIWQGRFKAFPAQDDERLVTVVR